MENKIIDLPEMGKVIIISDLHGHLQDFEFIIQKSRLIERLSSNENVYLIVMGDVCDIERHHFFANYIPPDGDIRILEKLIDLQNKFGKRRIIYIEGNHDFHILRIFEEFKNSGFSSIEEYVTNYRELYGEMLVANNIAPYDMIYRAKNEYLEFIGSGPLMVCSKNGIVVVHAGPIRFPEKIPDMKKTINSLKREEHFFAEPSESYYLQLLCNRYCLSQYTIEDIKNFLNLIDGKIMISGHTPLIHFEEDYQKFLSGCKLYEGMMIIGNMQVVLATSFGAYRNQKIYLELDLSKKYESPFEWKLEKEIFKIPVNTSDTSCPKDFEC